MPVTEVYVDPSIAANSGSGTIGDPYGDLQHALNTHTRDATNGNRFNIKAGTDEVFSAEISIATYGTPTFTVPLIFQGYTSTAGDGGKFGISGGGGTFNLWNKSTVEGVYFVDGRIHNFGSITGNLLTLDRFCGVDGVEFENMTVSGSVVRSSGTSGRTVEVQDCHFHDIAGNCLNRCNSVGNYFKNDGSKDITSCFDMPEGGLVAFNIASLDAASVFLSAGSFTSSNTSGFVLHNSVLSSSGTGVGIQGDRPIWVAACEGNIVEGFSGVGGTGFKIVTNSSTEEMVLAGRNAAYNNTTNYSGFPSGYDMLGDNETLSATPFAKSGSDTFANRFTYFAPVDTGNVFGGGVNNLDKGAVQRTAAAGGGGRRRRLITVS